METARKLQPHHISCYQLTIHRRTRFELLERRGQLVQMNVDDQGERFRQTHRYFNEAGYAGYEVSQFAVDPTHRSRHNSKYWDHTPYLGLGPSAHSLVGNRRWWNRRKTDDWQDEIRNGRRPLEESETLDAPALALEALMTGLRTYDGVDLARIEARWGIDVATPNREVIERLEHEGRLCRRGMRLIPTLEGLSVADSITTLFDLG
jgi:oxygen-independent coproporphyrinogen-3 oxidase